MPVPTKEKKPRMNWKAKCERQAELLKQQQANYSELVTRCEELVDKNMCIDIELAHKEHIIGNMGATHRLQVERYRDMKDHEGALCEKHFNIVLELDAKISDQAIYIRTLETSRTNLSDLLTAKSHEVQQKAEELIKQCDQIIELRSKIQESVRYIGSIESSAQAFGTMLGDSVNEPD
jgi:hypothetical protein